MITAVFLKQAGFSLRMMEIVLKYASSIKGRLAQIPLLESLSMIFLSMRCISLMLMALGEIALYFVRVRAVSCAERVISLA